MGCIVQEISALIEASPVGEISGKGEDTDH